MSQSKPNILYILTDQQHIDTIRAGGCRDVHTPALDRLYRNGVRFTQSYCTNPLCSPSRSSLFTGRMPTETGVWRNGKRGGPIIPSIPNLGEWFTQESDYETAYAGKWHVPQCHTAHIKGFDVIAAGYNHMGDVSDPVVSRTCAAWLRARARRRRPFLLVASLIQPHDMCLWLHINLNDQKTVRYPELRGKLPELPANFKPVANEPASLRRMRQIHQQPSLGNWGPLQWRYYLWNYYRHVEMVDAEIGRILEALDESGRADDTFIVFTSDHGEGMAHHSLVRKGYLYDEAAKVPLIFCMPARLRKNVTDREHLVSGLDIVPTLCDVAGIPTPPMTHARSVLPLLEGQRAPWRSCVVTENTGPGQSTGLIHDSGRMVRSKSYKYIRHFPDGREPDQLFDMQRDPGETRDLASYAKYTDIVREHQQMLADWERAIIPAPRVARQGDVWVRAMHTALRLLRSKR